MNPDDIANQQELLAAHRRTLAIYLRQLAKAELRDHGEQVDDAPRLMEALCWLRSTRRPAAPMISK
jgi:hypothetical protein